MTRRLRACACALALCTSARAAQAQTPPAASHDDEAREHFDRGVHLLQLQDYNGALAELQRAWALSPRPGTLCNVGAAEQALHRYPQAARSIEQCMREAQLSPLARAQYERGLAQIQDFIGHVTLRNAPGGAVIRIDGEALGRTPAPDAIALSVGTHQLELELAGYVPFHTEFSLSGHERSELTVVMRPLPPNTPGLPHVRLELVTAATHPRVLLDGRPTMLHTAITVTPGTHAVRVDAQGWATWSGTVRVNEGGYHIVRITLEPGGRLTPAPFTVAMVTTVALGVATIVTGTVAMQTHDAFRMLTQDSPQVWRLSDAGTAQTTATNILIGTTLGSAVVTGVLLARTRFGGTPSRADVIVAPQLEAMGATVSARF